MKKRLLDIFFIAIFMAVLTLPFLFADRQGGAISQEENRTKAEMPSIMVEDSLNLQFTSEYEDWLMDNMGFRDLLIDSYGKLNCAVFQKLNADNYYLGVNGDLNYFTDDMLKDYMHLNLRSESELESIAYNQQTVADWLKSEGVQYYYVQCYDKHSIYPEQAMNTVRPVGDISRTDATIDYLKANTSVNVISLKSELLDAKAQYEVYSNWGDPTHWTDRGAFIGYSYMMQTINQFNNNKFPILQETDYTITMEDKGLTLNSNHVKDMLECFTITSPRAIRDDMTLLGPWNDDPRHSVWTNNTVDNDTTLLLVGDSYFDSFILDDLAESFYRVYLIWGDYLPELPLMLEEFDPDIVIIECAERVDRTWAFPRIVNALTEESKKNELTVE